MPNTTTSERMDQLDAFRRRAAEAQNRTHVARLAGRRFDWWPPRATAPRANPFAVPSAQNAAA